MNWGGPIILIIVALALCFLAAELNALLTGKEPDFFGNDDSRRLPKSFDKTRYRP